MNELTDAEREQWLVDRERGGWENAVEQIIAARLNDYKARAVAAIEAEFLLDATGNAEDIAYDLAIKHAVRAVRDLT
jgi:hypothetical protein